MGAGVYENWLLISFWWQSWSFELVPNIEISNTPLSSILQQLKQQRDKLKQYQKKIQVQLEKERQVAKQLLRDGKKE